MDAAGALREMTQAIDELWTQQKLEEKKRSELLELLTTLADEASRPTVERRPATGFLVIGQIATLVSGIADLRQLWGTYAPAIAELFRR